MDEVMLARFRTAEALLGDDGLMVHDARYRIAFWGKRMEAMWGVSPLDMLGRRTFEALPFLVQNADDALFREALAGNTASSGPLPFAFAASGRRGLYEARYVPVRSDSGAVVGVAAVVRDVTETHELAQQLRETENRFRIMADAAPVLLWMSGPDSPRTFVNQTWLTFTGRTLEQEVGTGWAAGVHQDDWERCLAVYERAVAAHEQFEMEYRLRRADGEYRCVVDRAVPRFTPDGTFAGYIGSCIDVTDYRDLEAQLRHLVRDREDFVAVASHELRTPLTAMQLSLDRLLRDAHHASSNGDRCRFVRDATRSVEQAHRMAELVQELLDVSHLIRERVTLRVAPVDLRFVIATAVERLSEHALRAGCPLLLAQGASVVGHWDPARLERVIVNLLSNAIKYGAGKPVRIDVDETDHQAFVTVRDEGIGIAPDDQGRIFGQFERAVSARNYGGFGLGLWIVRQIVHMHGGSVKVTSAPGRGAAFKVCLPLGEALTRSE
jgi:PAS domain S-box-containing protein